MQTNLLFSSVKKSLHHSNLSLLCRLSPPCLLSSSEPSPLLDEEEENNNNDNNSNSRRLLPKKRRPCMSGRHLTTPCTPPSCSAPRRLPHIPREIPRQVYGKNSLSSGTIAARVSLSQWGPGRGQEGRRDNLKRQEDDSPQDCGTQVIT